MRTHGTEIQPIAYRVTEVARLLAIGRASAYRLIEKGHLRSIRVGVRSVRVLRKDLEEYLERQGQQVA